MKIEINDNKVNFTPIDLKITIESKRELEMFFACFNCSVDSLNKNTENYDDIRPFSVSEDVVNVQEGLWEKMENLIHKY